MCIYILYIYIYIYIYIYKRDEIKIYKNTGALYFQNRF